MPSGALPPAPLRNYNPNMARMTSLYRLQQAEKALHDARERLEEIDRILAEDERVAEAESRFEEAKDAYVTARSQMGEAEQAVASQRAKIKDTEESLYGGSVTNPKELEDLQLESESLKRYLSTLEDRMLEAMVELEEAEQVYEAAKEELEQTRAEVAAEHEDLTQEREQLRSRLDGLEAEVESELASVQKDDVTIYRKIKKRVGGFPIALVKGGTCSVCGMAIPGSKAQRVRGGDEVVRCESCGRILYQG